MKTRRQDPETQLSSISQYALWQGRSKDAITLIALFHAILPRGEVEAIIGDTRYPTMLINATQTLIYHNSKLNPSLTHRPRSSISPSSPSSTSAHPSNTTLNDKEVDRKLPPRFEEPVQALAALDIAALSPLDAFQSIGTSHPDNRQHVPLLPQDSIRKHRNSVPTMSGPRAGPHATRPVETRQSGARHAVCREPRRLFWRVGDSTALTTEPAVCKRCREREP